MPKKRWELEWERNYSHIWINLLKVSPWAEKAHKLLEIKKKRCSIEEVMENCILLMKLTLVVHYIPFATEFFYARS